jgi:hypothetical protein
MIERKTIQGQIDRVRRVTTDLGYILDTLAKGIDMEPMAFHMEAINALKLIAASADDLALSCNHALDFQRSEAQSKARRSK